MKLNTTPEAAVSAFRRHVATLSQQGEITELDWSRPGDSTYAMHVLFIPHLNRVVITGDLYDCVFCPTCACTLEAVAKCFTYRHADGKLMTNEGYFAEKVTTSKGLYTYSVDDACEMVLEMYNEVYGGEKDDDADSDDDDRPDLEGLLDDIHNEFTGSGVILTESIREGLQKIDSDWWEWGGDLGKRYDTFVTWWLVGLRLAWEQLTKKEAADGTPGGQ